MRNHPDYILPLALIAFGLLAEGLAWAWQRHRERHRDDCFYVIRKRGRIVRKRGK